MKNFYRYHENGKEFLNKCTKSHDLCSDIKMKGLALYKRSPESSKVFEEYFINYLNRVIGSRRAKYLSQQSGSSRTLIQLGQTLLNWGFKGPKLPLTSNIWKTTAILKRIMRQTLYRIKFGTIFIFYFVLVSPL